ncbi:GNAT family N-acetyltransferase [Palleronia caenipelagi]|uniref:GNAT family N-acetyltransferase n=1 Tax=Palleronia caenipelagi TaxID=2489174 RepID=A0A547Q6R0_9RHOB|nr:GNAT family N-acetyltransferase [Palleronia caenipelagi]TRD22068.1 GNAT family N-acetyltransferase [Palleronia caenipelagi]
MIDPERFLTDTWPAAATERLGPFTLRDGAGGGKRTEAATCNGVPDDATLDEAEAALTARQRPLLFRLRSDETAFDEMLAARGYARIDPTLWLSRPLTEAPSPPPVTGFAIWPPLQVQREIWDEGDVPETRRAVMARVAVPKVSVLGRASDKPAGTLFVAVSGRTAVVHALHVRPECRRQSMARHLMAHAERWAMRRGAREIGLFVTEANAPARALYGTLGFEGGPCYHYRIRD